MGYTINKGIDIPLDYQERGRHTIYPFAKMETGDSFLVPEYSRERMQSIGGALSVFKKKTSKRLEIHKNESKRFN